MSSEKSFPGLGNQEDAVSYVRVAKSFQYENTEAGKGVLFQGTVVAGADGLYLSHDKHSWQSAGTSMAMFGLLGLAIHAIATRNKQFEYPYPTLPADELSETITGRMIGHKFKPKSVVSIIPRDQVVSFTNGMLTKKFDLHDGVVLKLMAAVGQGMKKLETLGYVKG